MVATRLMVFLNIISSHVPGKDGSLARRCYRLCTPETVAQIATCTTSSDCLSDMKPACSLHCSTSWRSLGISKAKIVFAIVVSILTCKMERLQPTTKVLMAKIKACTCFQESAALRSTVLRDGLQKKAHSLWGSWSSPSL